MKPEKDFNISFEENARRGLEIIAKQPPVTYEQALEQVNRLRENSKVKESDKKRNRIKSK